MSSARGFLIVVGLLAIAPAPASGAAGDTLLPPTAPGANEAPPAAPAEAPSATPAEVPPDAAVATASPSPDAAPAPAPSTQAAPMPKLVVLTPVVTVQPPAPAERRSIARRPWFWLTIAAVVAAGAVGGLLLFRGSPKDPTGSLGAVDGN